MKKNILISFLLICTFHGFAQEDNLLHALMDTVKTDSEVYATFKSNKLINGQTVELIGKGVLQMQIMHRFGSMENAVYDFFGLDHATMRLGFDYGVSNRVSIGIGRSTVNKTYDPNIKIKFLHQSSKVPLTATLYSSVAISTIQYVQPSDYRMTDRMNYTTQLLLARKFNASFSLQFMPTIIHKNYVEFYQPNTYYALGAGGRLKLSNRIALTGEYYYQLNRTEFANSAAIGVDIETGGHVFQLQFTNSSAMTENIFITNTEQKFSDLKYLRFGFNLSRAFGVR